MKRILLACALLLPFCALAQVVSVVPSRVQLIFSSGTLQGNGADTTEDALPGYTGTVQLLNVGDAVHITARGVSAGSTDTKVIRMKIGGSNACVNTNGLASNVTWYLECWIVKTGANTQVAWFLSNNLSNTTVSNFFSLTVTDNVPHTVNITAQNSTAATQNSIQIQGALAQYFPAQ